MTWRPTYGAGRARRSFIAGAITAALLIWAAVALAGCYPVTEFAPPPKTPAPVVKLPPVVKACTQVVDAGFVELVNSIAAGDDWYVGLDAAVTATSLCAVRVAAEQLIAEYAGIKMEAGNVNVASRLKLWLEQHPNTGAP